MTSVLLMIMKMCLSIIIVMLAYCTPYYIYCRVKGYTDNGYFHMPDAMHFVFELFRFVLFGFFFVFTVYFVFWGIFL